MKVLATVAATCLLALAPKPAGAFTVFVSATYDLSNLSDFQSGSTLTFEQAFGLPTLLHEGDVVDFNLDFLGDQILIMNDPYHLNAELFNNVILNPNFRAAGYWEFYNTAGNLAPLSIVDQFGPTATDGFGAFATGHQITGPGPIQFAGFRLQLEVMDLIPNGPHPYENFRFQFGASSFEAGQIAVPGVPEPSTWAMMLLGFGATGCAMRRRRRSGDAPQSHGPSSIHA